MHQHPGGADLLEEYAGRDATRGFDDFGHSTDAKKIMKEYLIGELEDVSIRICYYLRAYKQDLTFSGITERIM
ncbi:Cytochrome b5 [Harpegnathos saltator]|uniref:Cytochrome b5 n=1 Tax=Harpegnathos saltator TaxID=610380 RepID=E2BPR4_HARSA|nr:Cytochrome b5 [Harpegnathos saltator]